MYLLSSQFVNPLLKALEKHRYVIRTSNKIQMIDDLRLLSFGDATSAIFLGWMFFLIFDNVRSKSEEV